MGPPERILRQLGEFLIAEADVRVDDRATAASAGKALEELEHIWRVQVVEQAPTHHSIETAVLLAREVAYIVLHKPHTREAERLAGEHRLCNVGLATLDAEHLR